MENAGVSFSLSSPKHRLPQMVAAFGDLDCSGTWHNYFLTLQKTVLMFLVRMIRPCFPFFLQYFTDQMKMSDY